MATVAILLFLPLLLLGALGLAWLGISRSGKQRRGLRRYEKLLNDSSPVKRRQETSVTLGPVATCRSANAARPMATTEAILQLVLDALHHLTGLPLLMVNQPDHNLPCLTRVETQMRADHKNAALLSSPRKNKHFRSIASWSDDEAPEEEMSDMDSDEEQEMQKTAEVACASSAQSQLFDGLEFYLAVSQVREQTVRSVLALGMAKTMTTMRDRKQNHSIALIQQRYPDFTCLPTSRSTAVQQLPKKAPMDLLSALRLPSAAAVAQTQSPMKTHHRPSEEEGRVRRPSLPSCGPNISRVA